MQNRNKLLCKPSNLIYIVMHNGKKIKWFFYHFCAYFNVFFISFKNNVSGEIFLSSKTKIVVFHMKELIYTGIFVLLGIILITLLISMFTPDSSSQPPKAETKQEALLPAPLIPIVVSY